MSLLQKKCLSRPRLEAGDPRGPAGPAGPAGRAPQAGRPAERSRQGNLSGEDKLVESEYCVVRGERPQNSLGGLSLKVAFYGRLLQSQNRRARKTSNTKTYLAQRVMSRTMRSSNESHLHVTSTLPAQTPARVRPGSPRRAAA